MRALVLGQQQAGGPVVGRPAVHSKGDVQPEEKMQRARRTPDLQVAGWPANYSRRVEALGLFFMRHTDTWGVRLIH